MILEQIDPPEPVPVDSGVFRTRGNLPDLPGLPVNVRSGFFRTQKNLFRGPWCDFVPFVFQLRGP